MKTLTFILVALVIGLAGLGYGLYERNGVQAAQIKSLTEAQNRGVERELEYRKLLATRAKENASQARKLAQAQQALSEALQANKSWSDTDVPPDVQNALGGPSGGSAGVFQHD